MDVEGPTADEAAMMAEAFSRRCPIYTTLALAAPIDVTNVVDGEEQEPFTTEADPITGADAGEEVELELARPSASGRLVEFGRALLSARGNHWIYDSVPPLNGPNEEVNPLDALVGALPACGIMVYEAAARESDIPLHSVDATVEADLDPRGVVGANVDPRIRAFRVTMNVDGPTAEEAEFLADEYRARCPIYTTFERSAPIEITNVVMGDTVTDLPSGPTLALRADMEIEEAPEVLDIVQMMLAFETGAWTPPDAALTTMVEGMVAGDLPPGPTALHRGNMQVTDVPEAFTLVQIVLDFAPGAWAPDHYHGGDALVTVLEGEMTRRINGEEETFGPGESWIEIAGEVHAAGNDTDEKSRVAVTFVLPHGAALTTAVEAADAEAGHTK